MNGFATGRNCAGASGRQSEGDDKFSFRRVESYMTQAFRGLPCRVKVKVRNREVGTMITEGECTTTGG